MKTRRQIQQMIREKEGELHALTEQISHIPNDSIPASNNDLFSKYKALRIHIEALKWVLGEEV